MTSTIITASAAEMLSCFGELMSSQPAIRRAMARRVASSARARAKLPKRVQRIDQTSSASQSPKTWLGGTGFYDALTRSFERVGPRAPTLSTLATLNEKTDGVSKPTRRRCCTRRPTEVEQIVGYFGPSHRIELREGLRVEHGAEALPCEEGIDHASLALSVLGERNQLARRPSDFVEHGMFWLQLAIRIEKARPRELYAHRGEGTEGAAGAAVLQWKFGHLGRGCQGIWKLNARRWLHLGAEL